jgi:hypothetical protein
MKKALSFESLERYAKTVQSLTIILGIFSGIFSLFAAQHERRVSKTVEMTKLYTDKVRLDYLELIANWDGYTKRIDNFFELDRAELKKRILSFFKDEKNHKLILNYLDFFDVLVVCIENNACDRNSAIDFFGPSAKLAYEISGYHIEETRQGDRDPSFGDGLKRFYRLPRQGFLGRYL